MGESGDGPLVGDTLELISIGGRSLPEGRGVRLPCDPAGTPLLERIVFTGDSTYTQIEVIRPGCRDPLVSGSDTLVIASEYRVHGDTLTLYTGGGDEMFQSYNGRIFRDSVVQIDIREDQVRRYARRHRVGRVAR
jgi:hypothetical protein